jgi:hypothetical protein
MAANIAKASHSAGTGARASVSKPERAFIMCL